MAKIADALFLGVSGTQYTFEAYSMDTAFDNVGAVYIFTRRTVTNNIASHKCLYIGQTDRLKDRISNHDKRKCLEANDANCICLYREDNEGLRIDKETDLRKNYKTPCNEQ